MIGSGLFSLDSLNAERFQRRRSEIVNISLTNIAASHTKKGGDTFKTALKINSEWWNLPPNNYRLVEQGISCFGWILARSGWNLVQFQEWKCNLGADLSLSLNSHQRQWLSTAGSKLFNAWGGAVSGLRLHGLGLAWQGTAYLCLPVTSGKMGFLSTS